MLSLKLDLHVHTLHSGDSITSVDEAIEWAKRRELDGIAIADHNTMDAFEEIPEDPGIIVIPGEEIDTQKGHLIALGITEKIPSGLLFSETLQLIRERGGVSVVPHPFDFFRSGVGSKTIRSHPPDAIEVINSHSLFFNLTKRLGFSLAEELDIACVAGSDSHLPESIGDAYVIVSCKEPSRVEILRSIREGRTQVFGAPTNLWLRLKTFSLTLNYLKKNYRPIF